MGTGQLHSYIQALDKGDEASQREAIHSLKQHQKQLWEAAPAKEITYLVKSLQNQLSGGMKQPSIRQEVATILGNLGPSSEPAIPQLIELLQDGNPDAVCEAAVIALGKIGKEAKAAVDRLIVLLSSRRPALVLQSIRALGEIGCADQRVRTALSNLWLSPNQTQKSQIELAIALCKLKIIAPGLLKAVTHTLVASQDSALRKSAAQALGWCRKDEIDVVPALLVAAVHDKDDDVRLVAEAGLVQLKLTREKAIHLCSKQLMESAHAEAALRNSGQPAVSALVEALAAPEPPARIKAARILGCLGELAVEAGPALTGTLRDKDLEVRLAAAKALWLITKQADSVIPVLVELLDEKCASVFEAGEPRRRFLQTVIESLGRIGQPAKAAVGALTQKTKDKNRLISESAATALKEIAPTLAIKTK